MIIWRPNTRNTKKEKPPANCARTFASLFVAPSSSPLCALPSARQLSAQRRLTARLLCLLTSRCSRRHRNARQNTHFAPAAAAFSHAVDFSLPLFIAAFSSIVVVVVVVVVVAVFAVVIVAVAVVVISSASIGRDVCRRGLQRLSGARANAQQCESNLFVGLLIVVVAVCCCEHNVAMAAASRSSSPLLPLSALAAAAATAAAVVVARRCKMYQGSLLFAAATRCRVRRAAAMAATPPPPTELTPSLIAAAAVGLQDRRRQRALFARPRARRPLKLQSNRAFKRRHASNNNNQKTNLVGVGSSTAAPACCPMPTSSVSLA